MPLPGFRRALVVGLVLLALGVGLASTHATASAQAPPGGTITTQLQPGWNMIGWLGPDTTAAELFDAIPALNFIVAWDGGAQRYRWVWRASLGQQALPWIQGGRGLALHIRGEAAVEWTRPAAEGVVLLPLRAGANLVAWGGLDGTPIEEALDWLGDAVVGASRWNADTGASERYRPGAPPSANTLRTLNHGDALWVKLTEDASWWQSGTAGTEFVFEGDVPAETQLALRKEMARVLAFYTERYGIETPEFFVLVDPELDIVAAANAEQIWIGRHAIDDPLRESVYAHEYFHVLQHHLTQQAPSAGDSPLWLTEGSATYADGMYRRERQGWTADRVRTDWWRRSLRVPHALRAIEARPAFDAYGYDLGALATDWLVRRAAALSADGDVHFEPLAPDGPEVQGEYDAHLQYYRLRQATDTWQEAFEGAFGITIDDFYEAFAEYRAKLGASRLRHLADDRDEPVIVFVGEVPRETAESYRARLSAVQTLFHDRFETAPAEYTVHVVADYELATAEYLRLFGGVFPEEICGEREVGAVLFLVVGCVTYEDPMLRFHHDTVVRQMTPWASLPSVPVGQHELGPEWLRDATDIYARDAYHARIRSTSRSLAAQADEPLVGVTESGAPRPPYRLVRALRFLAADWLTQRAGEPALFEYYRLLPSSDTWQDAFQGAFGITIDDFYAAFAEYRAAGFER